MATDSRNADFATKYSKTLDQIFSESSLTAAHVSREDSFKDDGGVASVYFRTIDTSDFLEGHSGPTFSAPSSVNSDVTRKDVELFYQINKVIPAVHRDDTAGAESAAGEILATGIRERYAPLVDKLNIATAIAAATLYGGKNVVTYTAGKLMSNIDSMIAELKNNRSYAKTQVLLVPASVEPELDTELISKFAPETNDKILATGSIGKYKGVTVVIVPDDLFNTMALTGTAPYATARFTAAPNIKAMIWDRRVMKTCRKLYETYVLTGKMAIAAGADGPVLRGLFRPGAWVMDANGTKKAVAIVKSNGSV